MPLQIAQGSAMVDQQALQDCTGSVKGSVTQGKRAPLQRSE
jgi:hypothetical protein